MRILLTADPEVDIPPKLYGGIERIIDSIIDELTKRGHTIGLLANGNSSCKVDQLFPWPGQASQNKIDILKNTIKLVTTVNKYQPDLIHSFSRVAYLLPLLGKSIPKIMSYQRTPAGRSVSWGSKLARGTLTFTGPSEYTCRQGEIGGGKWHAIHNFIDPKTFTFQPTVDADAPLVFLSRIEKVKGAHTAIEIAKRSSCRLLIAGNYSETGENGHYWKEQIQPHLGKNGIEYIGTVDDKQKNELLGKAAAMIVPIEWDEHFGIVNTESLACGTPVISCPRGALPEIIRPGIDGFLINSIEEACEAIKKIPTIDRHQCRQRVEKLFSVEVIVDKYEHLYQQLIIET